MFRSAILLATLLAASSALAAEPQYLSQSTGLSNDLSVDILGDANFLSIDQAHFGSGGSNAIALSINGDRNGGANDWSFGGSLAGELMPGTLMQSGSGNGMQVAVTGTDNTFAFAQVGNGNALTASISGTYNQAIVYQVGDGNSVGFSQNGVGNVLLISQRSN